MPNTAGGVIGTGARVGTAATADVGTDVADDEPRAFVAVTVTRRLLPTSAAAAAYAVPVAPSIFVHVALQRLHW
jgi:hypothetical protein